MKHTETSNIAPELERMKFKIREHSSRAAPLAVIRSDKACGTALNSFKFGPLSNTLSGILTFENTSRGGPDRRSIFKTRSDKGGVCLLLNSRRAGANVAFQKT